MDLGWIDYIAKKAELHLRIFVCGDSSMLHVYHLGILYLVARSESHVFLSTIFH